ncbi:hypothetical protein ACGFYK_38115, partial [Streptomyces sp. NPDC048340]
PRRHAAPAPQTLGRPPADPADHRPSRSPAVVLVSTTRTAGEPQIGNLAAADLSQITRAVKRRLKQIQYRPDLVDGCLAGTDLIMDG